MNDKYYENKVAVVTGAGGTLCSEISLHLAEKGAITVLIGRTKEKLQKTADKIEKVGGKCVIFSADVTDEAKIAEIGEWIMKEYGACRFLINGAGGNNIKAMTTNIQFDPHELSEDKPDDMRGFFNLDMSAFENVLKVNTMGSVIPTYVFARQMAESGEGCIINFASMNSYRPLTRVAPYAMSKAAVVNMTQWFATYLATANIRVNAIAPGFFVNERSKNYLGTPETGLTARGQNVINHTPMAKFGRASDLLGAVDFLTDDRMSAFVTGITLAVDGGFLSHSGI